MEIVGGTDYETPARYRVGQSVRGWMGAMEGESCYHVGVIVVRMKAVHAGDRFLYKLSGVPGYFRERDLS